MRRVRRRYKRFGQCGAAFSCHRVACGVDINRLCADGSRDAPISTEFPLTGRESRQEERRGSFSVAWRAGISGQNLQIEKARWDEPFVPFASFAFFVVKASGEASLKGCPTLYAQPDVVPQFAHL